MTPIDQKREKLHFTTTRNQVKVSQKTTLNKKIEKKIHNMRNEQCEGQKCQNASPGKTSGKNPDFTLKTMGIAALCVVGTGCNTLCPATIQLMDGELRNLTNRESTRSCSLGPPPNKTRRCVFPAAAVLGAVSNARANGQCDASTKAPSTPTTALSPSLTTRKICLTISQSIKHTGKDS